MSPSAIQSSRALTNNSTGSSDTEHQEAVTHSAQQSSDTPRYIDFISESPYDLLCVIVAFFDQDTMAICINVCREWRRILLECPVPWREMYIHNSRHTAILSAISRYVNKLSIYDAVDCVKSLHTLNLSHLQSLAIINESPFLDDVDEADMSDTIPKALSYIQDTLTELYLCDYLSDRTQISLAHILSKCRRLTVLVMDIKFTDFPRDMPLRYPTSLTRIEIDRVSSCVQDIHSFHPLFRYSPNLRFVKLDMCNDDDDITPILEVHCFKLAVLLTNAWIFNLNENHPGYPETSNLERHDGGLELIAIHAIRSAHHIWVRLHRSCDTLRSMYIAPVAGNQSVRQNWRPLSSFVLNALTTLHINFRDDQSLHEHLSVMLRQFPNLETIWLERIHKADNEETTNEIFDAMTSLKNLSCLDLRYFDINGEGFLEFLRHHATNPASILWRLAIYECYGVVPSVLNQIGNNRRLEQACLWRPGEEVTAQDIEEFMLLLAQLPELATVNLGELVFTNEAARNLASSTSLSYLWLVRPVGLTDEGEDILRDRLDEELHVYH
ncbi:hypothetical protein BJV82DRAFT_590292 [Fennellomyces sp. T-0311]|nr:hypothetical protein BJV82DRAFT_590292 [Fennellomyces sp. T-0311]